jgi:membrane associated rhomboid family serine protease
MIPIRDTVPTRHPPVATTLLVIANVTVFLFELTLPPRSLEYVVHQLGIVPARYTHPAWAALTGFPLHDFWPFLTAMFLHGSFLHLLGNVWTLWIFGDNVEDRMGPGRFVVFYLLCGLASGFVHVVANPNSVLPTVGASGAIAGVMGAYFVLFPQARVIVMVPVLFWPFFFELPAVTYLAWWALAQFFAGTLTLGAPVDMGGVAWWAHLGGFMTGIVLQFAFVRRASSQRPLGRDEYGIDAAWVPAGHWRRAQ